MKRAAISLALVAEAIVVLRVLRRPALPGYRDDVGVQLLKLPAHARGTPEAMRRYLRDA